MTQSSGHSDMTNMMRKLPEYVYEAAIQAYARANELGQCPDHCVFKAAEAVWQAAQQAQPVVDGDASHKWGRHAVMPNADTCKLCGVVRRTDRKNGTCKGIVKIGLREAALQHPAETKENRLDCKVGEALGIMADAYDEEAAQNHGFHQHRPSCIEAAYRALVAHQPQSPTAAPFVDKFEQMSKQPVSDDVYTKAPNSLHIPETCKENAADKLIEELVGALEKIQERDCSCFKGLDNEREILLWSIETKKIADLALKSARKYREAP